MPDVTTHNQGLLEESHSKLSESRVTAVANVDDGSEKSASKVSLRPDDIRGADEPLALISSLAMVPGVIEE